MHFLEKDFTIFCLFSDYLVKSIIVVNNCNITIFTFNFIWTVDTPYGITTSYNDKWNQFKKDSDTQTCKLFSKIQHSMRPVWLQYFLTPLR